MALLHDLSLRTRAVMLSVLLVGLPALVCGGILIEIEGIRRDADRLLEETRETGVANRLLGRIESLRAAVASVGESPRSLPMRDFASDLSHEARTLLVGMHKVPARDDPSRAEHQSKEYALLSTISAGLDGVDAWLPDGTDRELPDVLSRLDRAREQAAVLAEETHRESELADRDVDRRARASQRYVLVSLSTVILASCTGLWLVFHVVLARIRRLKLGAERLRGGDLAHRMDIRGHDEIGELGRAFDELAAEVRRSHDDLREQVESRTRELVHAARLADVGVLAAGLAHEVNNPLASIASCGEGLLRRLDAGTLDAARQREYVETIVAEAYRTRDITRQLLDLARPAPSDRGAVDVERLFRQVERLTAHLLEAKSLRLRVEIERELPPLVGDAGELLQVLINLILNARDASPPGSTIALRAAAAGGAQVWEVQDSGTGIPPDALDRIFDPFYTTKDPGAGTGLGLSLVAAIVDRHRGTIRAANVEGGGACISLRLPSGREAA